MKSTTASFLSARKGNIPFLSHSDTTDPSKHLNESKLHFNRQGIRVFAENISGFLTKLNSHQHENGNILTNVSCKEFQPNVSNFNDSVSPRIFPVMNVNCRLELLIVGNNWK